MIERISFPLNRKSVATGRNKRLVQKVRIREMEKLLPMEGIFEKLGQSGLQQPENLFPLTGMQDFPLAGKIKLAVAGAPGNGRKKWFLIARKSVSTTGTKLFFKNQITRFPLAEKKNSK